MRKKLKERDKLDIETNQESIQTLFNDHNDRIDSLNKEIDDIMNKRTEGAMHRSRAQWYQCAEKSSKYFLSLEKHNYNKKVINKIKNKDGMIVEGTQSVLEVFNDYYQNIFQGKNIEIDPDYLALLNVLQLKERDRYWLEGPIQLEEIHLALKKMNLSKCPGTDGLTVEFYLKFWLVLATTIHRLFELITERKLMNRSAREAVTSLMPKPTRDSLNIRSWRPLSLLNNDYKLYAKVLAERMATPAAYLIPSEQRGFIKGRTITDNLLNMLSIVEHCNTNNIDALLLSIDYSQAFDCCNWDAIRATLVAFRYGPKFIDMIMTCCNQIKTAIMNNKTWSKWIDIASGVRQGCPLSGILFDHLVSIIYFKISQNENIRGIQLNNVEKIADLFADDMWNVIPFNKDIFDELMYEHLEFEYFSGLKINYDKTEIMRLGSIRNTNARFYSQFPLIWSDGPIKILGIDVFDAWSLSSENNYQKIMNKIQD